ncbi:putative export-like chaperone [Fictibacillus macauensis ZFHKF-1]|uniref:Putative export-like chaperone n=1 Tax=Fictibacillus macauensis ZFHKF-1 TaxID=1196324 RepID=I8IYG4_9BACL|nr:tRNA-binding protein [Fictibacillus macauensis]EIT84501.1 putative export-like chaperone [Fictibacillus macauensis ZFHKF-1]
MEQTLSMDTFMQVDIRVGRIMRVEPFTKARKPAYKLWIDFGEELGIKKSSAQITAHYTPETLQDRLIMAVVNFPPRQIADFMSEVLVLGIPQENESEVVLIQPDLPVNVGLRLL